jgi:hypothetical protein
MYIIDMSDLAMMPIRRDHLISNPPDMSIISCAVVTVFIAGVFVALRFYTRCFIVKKVIAEDWLIVASFLFATAATAGNCARE